MFIRKHVKKSIYRKVPVNIHIETAFESHNNNCMRQFRKGICIIAIHQNVYTKEIKLQYKENTSLLKTTV